MEKMLIIGEDLAHEKEILRFFERQEYQVLSASGLDDGLAKLQREQPSLVMVDHDLEGMDGVEVLKRVRETAPACEVILVTPGGEIEAAIEVLRAGALDYLRRPVDVEQLQIALGRARERRLQRRDTEPAAILVLEDHEPTRKRLVKVLEKEGYRVYSAPDGEQGLQLFHEKRLDLILADVRMPHKDGIDVLREIKGNGADVEVIVITGYGDEDVVVNALRDGAINFLRKPIDIEQMLLAIQKALDFQTLRRSLAYRNRDIQLMQELVVRLTSKLELVVETPDHLSPKARNFLHDLVNALPLGIVVIGVNREVIFANQAVVNRVGESPIRLSTNWLKQMGVHRVTEEELVSAIDRTMGSQPGSIETLVISKWSFLVMTPLKLLRPDRTERFVALAIRGERKQNGR